MTIFSLLGQNNITSIQGHSISQSNVFVTAPVHEQ